MPTTTGDDRAARDMGFRAGFTIACVELSKAHGEDALAKMLLDNAGLSREAAKAATEADDHDEIDRIFDV